MIRQLTVSALALALAAGPLHAASTPSSGRLDPRIRNAIYNPDQVFVVETDLRHATTLHFGQGETFQAVIVGDTESFEVDPIPEIGNILTIKPHVAKARTNMTVVTPSSGLSSSRSASTIPRTAAQAPARASSARALPPSAMRATSGRATAISPPARSMTTAVTPTSSFPRTPASPRSSRSTGKAASARSTGRSKATWCAFSGRAITGRCGSATRRSASTG